MTDAEIFKLAITCGLDEFVNEPLLKFAREMYDKGREDESELHVDENY
jgi:hypothetical protein